MASPVARAEAVVADLRRRSPLADHAARALAHYGEVRGSALASAVTYYGFLSFFPLLAVAFFLVGYVARIYPDARDNLVTAIDEVLPGVVGSGDGEITISTIEHAATTAGVLGVLGLLYTGLSWLSGMRTALEAVFELPRGLRPGFVVGKLRDLLSLLVVGVVLLVSVGVTGAAVGWSDKVLDVLGADEELSWLVALLGPLLGILTNTVLFYAFFRLLTRPRTPRRALWQGALLGGVAFEVLKQISSYLLAVTRNAPAFQAFGIALILLVWINYFSRVVVLAAAWAHTAPSARERAAAEAAPLSADSLALRERVEAARSAQLPPASPPREALVAATPRRTADPRVAFAAGAAAALALVAAIRRRSTP
jgi:membrane protein